MFPNLFLCVYIGHHIQVGSVISIKISVGKTEVVVIALLRIVQIYASEAASTVRTKLVSCFTQVF